MQPSQSFRYWDRIKNQERWGPEWSLAALAAADSVSLSLASYADGLYRLVQPHADAFGKACSLDQAYITNFGEEVKVVQRSTGCGFKLGSAFLKYQQYLEY